MKTAALLFALATSLARADLVMVHESGVGEPGRKSVTSIKGKMLRLDEGDKVSMIVNTGTGKAISLQHDRKIARNLDLNAAKAARKAEGKDMETHQPVSTGMKEEIGGFECEIYTLKHGEIVTKIWSARNYPGYEKMKAELAPLRDMPGPVTANRPELPGPAIKTESNTGGMVLVSKLVSFKEEALDDKIFALPADYQVMNAD